MLRKGETAMSKIFLYKTKPKRMKSEEFSKIAQALGVEKKLVETDEAFMVHDSTRALVYAQPGAKFGGLLFYTDQSKGMSEVSEKLLDVKRAKRWADDFLSEFNLIPQKGKDKRIDFHFETSSYLNEAITFNGKERRRSKVKTEIASKISLNGISVTGARAKVRMVFKNQARPIMIHRGLWENIEVYEERELVREHDIIKTVKEKLAKRSNCKSVNNIVDVKLAYLAAEFEGGPDLLAPYYFIDVEFEDRNAQEVGIEQGPRQVFWLPAYR
jgi:hypothetical protein